MKLKLRENLPIEFEGEKQNTLLIEDILKFYLKNKNQTHPNKQDWFFYSIIYFIREEFPAYLNKDIGAIFNVKWVVIQRAHANAISNYMVEPAFRSYHKSIVEKIKLNKDVLFCEKF